MSSALFSQAEFEAGLRRFDEARRHIAEARALVEEVELTVWMGDPLTQFAGWVELWAGDRRPPPSASSAGATSSSRRSARRRGSRPSSRSSPRPSTSRAGSTKPTSSRGRARRRPARRISTRRSLLRARSGEGVRPARRAGRCRARRPRSSVARGRNGLSTRALARRPQSSPRFSASPAGGERCATRGGGSGPPGGGEGKPRPGGTEPGAARSAPRCRGLADPFRAALADAASDVAARLALDQLDPVLVGIPDEAQPRAPVVDRVRRSLRLDPEALQPARESRRSRRRRARCARTPFPARTSRRRSCRSAPAARRHREGP